MGSIDEMKSTGNFICIIVSFEEVGNPLGIKLFHIRKSNRKGRIACMERFGRVRFAQYGGQTQDHDGVM